MNQGWKGSVRISVYINKRYRKGILKSQKDGKWDFIPDGCTKTRRICPVKNKWHYDCKSKLNRWRQKIKVLFIDNKPFKLKRERFGKWHGAKTARTKAVSLPVWQVPGTATVFVGHLGSYTIATVHDGKLQRLTSEPHQKEQYFIGRGKLSGPTFKTLKTVHGGAPRMKRKDVEPLYKIPSRDELG
jgi:hypothetical protein